MKLRSLIVGILLSTGCLLATHTSIAQPGDNLVLGRVYITNALNGGILSTANVKYTLTDASKFGIPRYSLFFNIGKMFHYNFNENFGIISGIDIKNIGYITKPNWPVSGYAASDDIKIKRRVYTIGIPLGVKFGNLRNHGFYAFAGGGIDIPFNYKEKLFHGGKKEKFNEWFSDRTPAIMPYLFAGVRLPNRLRLTVSYYPNNFMNTEFVDKNVGKPYYYDDVNLINVSLGYELKRGYSKMFNWKSNHKSNNAANTKEI